MTIDIRKLAVAALVAGGAAAAWWLARPEASPEQRVRAAIDAMREGAEARSVADVMRHVDASYRDASGMTRDELRAYLLGHLLGAQRIGVTVLRERIDVAGAGATADLTLLLTRDGSRDTRRVTLRLGEIGGEWKLVGSDHEPAAAEPAP